MKLIIHIKNLKQALNNELVFKKRVLEFFIEFFFLHRINQNAWKI